MIVEYHRYTQALSRTMMSKIGIARGSVDDS